MDSKKLNDWLQVVGLFAVVGSLIFVGLQMRQTQEIALSQAYQSRAETSINTMLAHLENDAALSGMTKMYEGHSDELTPNESTALFVLAAARMIHLENVHYQYQQGFVSQEHWDTQLAEMRGALSDPSFRVAFGNPAMWRASFAKIIKELYEEIDGGTEVKPGSTH